MKKIIVLCLVILSLFTVVQADELDDEIKLVKYYAKLRQEPVKVSTATRELLANTIMGEAGIESFDGKLAVATVVMNRVQNRYMGADTIKEVVYQKRQFSCVQSKNWYREKPTKDCYLAADMVLRGFRSFERDIMYYANMKIATDTKFTSKIASRHSIGRHTFGVMKK